MIGKKKEEELYPFYISKALGLEVPFLFLALGLDSLRVFHVKVKINCCEQTFVFKGFVLKLLKRIQTLFENKCESFFFSVVYEISCDLHHGI